MGVSMVAGAPYARVVQRTPYVRWGKPLFDRVAAAVLLVVLAPVLAAVALAIRVTMGPGVIFRQARVGRGGDDFVILKFRTMQHDRRGRQAPITFADRRCTHKTLSDPRHTQLGRLLRATSIDELPQLVNVLRGDMSLVGPRPELSCVADQYGFRYHPRHEVLPGITGLWQISPERGELLHHNLDIDLGYLEQVGLLTDLRILGGTFSDVLGRAGS